MRKSRPYTEDLHKRLRDREQAAAYLKECSDDFETYKLASQDVIAALEAELADVKTKQASDERYAELVRERDNAEATAEELRYQLDKLRESVACDQKTLKWLADLADKQRAELSQVQEECAMLNSLAEYWQRQYHRIHHADAVDTRRLDCLITHLNGRDIFRRRWTRQRIDRLMGSDSPHIDRDLIGEEKAKDV